MGVAARARHARQLRPVADRRRHRGHAARARRVVRDARRGRRVRAAAARRSTTRSHAPPLFGRGAAWLTRAGTVAQGSPRFPAPRDVNGMPAEIHWKTGTSFGFRDAWAVGSGPAYTAVVWTGNVDRQAERRARRLGGRRAAAVRRARRRSPIARTARACRPTARRSRRGRRLRVLRPHPGRRLRAPRQGARAGPRGADRAVPVSPGVRRRAHTGRAVRARMQARRARRTTAQIVHRAAERASPRGSPRASAQSPTRRCSPTVAPATPAARRRSIVTPGEGRVTLVPGMPAKAQAVPLSRRRARAACVVRRRRARRDRARGSACLDAVAGKRGIVVADDAGRVARRTLEVRATLR